MSDLLGNTWENYKTLWNDDTNWAIAELQGKDLRKYMIAIIHALTERRYITGYTSFFDTTDLVKKYANLMSSKNLTINTFISDLDSVFNLKTAYGFYGGRAFMVPDEVLDKEECNNPAPNPSYSTSRKNGEGWVVNSTTNFLSDEEYKKAMVYHSRMLNTAFRASEWDADIFYIHGNSCVSSVGQGYTLTSLSEVIRTSGAKEPNWNIAENRYTIDNQILWRKIGTSTEFTTWEAGRSYEYGDIIKNSDNKFFMFYGCKNLGSEPVWNTGEDEETTINGFVWTRSSDYPINYYPIYSIGDSFAKVIRNLYRRINAMYRVLLYNIGTSYDASVWVYEDDNKLYKRQYNRTGGYFEGEWKWSDENFNDYVMYKYSPYYQIIQSNTSRFKLIGPMNLNINNLKNKFLTGYKLDETEYDITCNTNFILNEIIFHKDEDKKYTRNHTIQNEILEDWDGSNLNKSESDYQNYSSEESYSYLYNSKWIDYQNFYYFFKNGDEETIDENGYIEKSGGLAKPILNFKGKLQFQVENPAL